MAGLAGRSDLSQVFPVNALAGWLPGRPVSLLLCCVGREGLLVPTALALRRRAHALSEVYCGLAVSNAVVGGHDGPTLALLQNVAAGAFLRCTHLRSL